MLCSFRCLIDDRISNGKEKNRNRSKLFFKLLTIVIPTYNEGTYIARTLYAIASQSGTHKIKIIID